LTSLLRTFRPPLSVISISCSLLFLHLPPPPPSPLFPYTTLFRSPPSTFDPTRLLPMTPMIFYISGKLRIRSSHEARNTEPSRTSSCAQRAGMHFRGSRHRPDSD